MANIQDVAKKAGVSISTVSRVLNGTAKVNVEVIKRVEVAIQELAYQPNPAARSLRTNHTRIIGLLVTDILNPFFINLIQGVEEEALRHDYSLILCNTNENSQREQQYLDILYSERVAGVIVVPTREKLDEAILTKFRERNKPIVAVNRRVKNKEVDTLLVDNVKGAHDATAHLIVNGYRRIGAIIGPFYISTERDCLQGYRQALREAGIANDPVLERSGMFDTASGRRLAEELLNLNPPIDALFVGNNLLTIGALDAIYAHKLHIPDDIAIIGFDEPAWSARGSLFLTTVTQPAYQLGSAAALQLFSRLENVNQAYQEIILPPALTLRNSTLPKVAKLT